MLCGPTLFKRYSGCTKVDVELSFPDIDFCEKSFVPPHINIPKYREPLYLPAPDFAWYEIPKCINISPIVSLSIHSKYDTPEGSSALTRSTFYVAPLRPLARALEEMGSSSHDYDGSGSGGSGGSGGSSGSVASGDDKGASVDCINGNYGMRIHFNIPCQLDNWPSVAIVKTPGDKKIGRMEFQHFSGCRVSGKMVIDGCIKKIGTGCPLDIIDGNIVENAPSGNLHIDGTQCGLTYEEKIPTPASGHSIHVDIKYKFYTNNYDKPDSIDISPISECGKAEYTDEIYLPDPVNVIVSGGSGVYVSCNLQEREYGPYREYRMSAEHGKVKWVTGHTGTIGPRGQNALRIVGRRGPTGTRGPRGVRGPTGTILCPIQRGPRGTRGDPTRCTVKATYPNGRCALHPEVVATFHFVEDIELVVNGSDTYVRVAYGDCKMHVDVGRQIIFSDNYYITLLWTKDSYYKTVPIDVVHENVWYTGGNYA